MGRLTNSLDRVRVAAPCEADWGEMRGDERVRFCARCSLNVYNLSALTRREAERLVVGAEGRLCVRFYRRADGTMLTRNCPGGLAALKRRVSRVASAAAAAAISFLAGVGVAPATRQTEQGQTSVAAAPVAGSQSVTPAVTAEEEAAVAEGDVAIAGGMSLDPLTGFVLPLGFLGALTGLLGWPLLKIGAWQVEKRREKLRIWSNDWELPGETARRVTEE